jgi:hypothetical protein
MMLPLRPGGSATLSVTDRCLWRGGDRTNILFQVPHVLVNIAHFQKLRLFPAMTIRTVQERMVKKEAALEPDFQLLLSLPDEFVQPSMIYVKRA